MAGLVPRPDKSTPIVDADKISVLQSWFDFFGYVESQIKAAIASSRIVGTTTNDNAAVGFIGEYVENVGAPVGLTSNVGAQIATITLSAGDWNISAGFIASGTGATTSNDIWASINTVSAVNVNTAGQASRFRGTTLTDPIWAQSIGPLRVSLASSTIYYLNGQAQIGASIMNMTGIIRARRAR